MICKLKINNDIEKDKQIFKDIKILLNNYSISFNFKFLEKNKNIK